MQQPEARRGAWKKKWKKKKMKKKKLVMMEKYEKTKSKQATWCFTPSQPLRLYQGEEDEADEADDDDDDDGDDDKDDDNEE